MGWAYSPSGRTYPNWPYCGFNKALVSHSITCHCGERSDLLAACNQPRALQFCLMNCRQAQSPMRRTYSIEFLRLQQGPCFCVPRNVKRRLQYFRIFVHHISTVVSFRRAHANKPPRTLPSARVPVQLSAERKLRRKRTSVSRFPSILLANVRSFTNKHDEIQLRTEEINPDVVVITESCTVGLEG